MPRRSCATSNVSGLPPPESSFGYVSFQPNTTRLMPRRRRFPEKPCPFRKGDIIRPVAMFQHHDYREGETYTVEDIDAADATLRARDSSGAIHAWIRWCDCKAAGGIGWEWLKSQLPAEALELLSSFHGLERLRLRPEVAVALVEELPSLKEKILEASSGIAAPSADC